MVELAAAALKFLQVGGTLGLELAGDMAALVLGVGLAVLIILFVASISITEKPSFDDEFASIEKRLAQI